MPNTAKFFLCLLCLALAPLVYADNLLFKANYSGKSGGQKVKAERSLIEKGDGSYQFRSIVKHRFGTVTENTHFELIEGTIFPVDYAYNRKIIGFKRKEFTHFDWTEKKAKFEVTGKPDKAKVHDLLDGMLDPSVYQLQLQRDLNRLQGDTQEKTLEYSFVKQRKIKRMQFKQVENEALKVGQNEYMAIKLLHEVPNSKKMTLVWLIPDLNYQIGKILHVDKKGKVFTLQLESFEKANAIFNAIYPRH